MEVECSECEVESGVCESVGQVGEVASVFVESSEDGYCLFSMDLVKVGCKILNRLVALKVFVDVAVLVSIGPVCVILHGFKGELIDRSCEMTEVSLDAGEGGVDFLFARFRRKLLESGGG